MLLRFSSAIVVHPKVADPPPFRQMWKKIEDLAKMKAIATLCTHPTGKRACAPQDHQG